MRTDSLPCATGRAQAASGPCKMVVIESSAAMGGIQHTTLSLLQRLDRARWDPILICPEEGELTQACRHAGVTVHILPQPALYSTSFWIGNRRKLPNPLAWAWNVAAMRCAAHRLGAILAAESPDLVMTKGLLCHF